MEILVKYLKGRECDHIVEQKLIETSYKDSYKNRHHITLKHYPAEYYDDDYEHLSPKRNTEWWVEIDAGGCFNELYNDEKSARLSYDLIDRQFCINIENWHILRKNAETFRRKFMDLHGIQMFEGKK